MLGKDMADAVGQEPEGDVTDASSFDTEQLGFMCGIEVHQQLATGNFTPANHLSSSMLPSIQYLTNGLDMLGNFD